MDKLNAVLEQLKQPSTIRGLIGLAGAVGLAVDPTKIEAIIAGVLVLQGLVNIVLTQDHPKQ